MLTATQLRQPEALRHSLIGSEKRSNPRSPALYPSPGGSLKICIIYGIFAVTLDKIEYPLAKLLAINDK